MLKVRLGLPGACALALALAAGCGGNDPSPGAGAPSTTGPDAASGPSGGAAGAGGTGGTGGGVPGGGGAAGVAGAAGGGEGPPAGGRGGSGPATSDAAPTGGGRPRPARFVVLGDSIAACSNIGNENGPDCSLKKLFDHLKSRHAPALVYENEAAGSAVTSDIPAQQLARVEGGSGHVLVLVYVGGNDLAKYMFALDTVAEQGLASDLPKVLAAWSAIFAHFEDRARFPDGYTLIVNNQYNPFDDCTAAPYFLTAKKSQLLATFNAALAQLARERGAVLTDQYTPYLGHGHHYQVRTCPHYQQGATPFMDDLIHPNAAGHENLFQQWKKVVDALYN